MQFPFMKTISVSIMSHRLGMEISIGWLLSTLVSVDKFPSPHRLVGRDSPPALTLTVSNRRAVFLHLHLILWYHESEMLSMKITFFILNFFQHTLLPGVIHSLCVPIMLYSQEKSRYPSSPITYYVFNIAFKTTYFFIYSLAMHGQTYMQCNSILSNPYSPGHPTPNKPPSDFHSFLFVFL